MPVLQNFPPDPDIEALMEGLPIRSSEGPVRVLEGPEAHLGHEAAGAILVLHTTMIDNDKAQLFHRQVAATLIAAASAPGMIRVVMATDGLSNDAYILWRSVEEAKAFASNTVHREAVSAMLRDRFEYTHFAGLWQQVEPRDRHVFCEKCGAESTMPIDHCSRCGNEVADVFRIQAREMAESRTPSDP